MSNNEHAKKPRKPRKPKAITVYDVIRKAQTLFEKQVIQNTESKRGCIERNISEYYGDSLRFWTEFVDEANTLVDSVRFQKYCTEHSMEARYVAEHIVFEGKGVKEDVLKKGVQILGEKVRMFNAPLYVDKERIFQNPEEKQDTEA